MLQPERREKIKALLASPYEGERSAARAALERTTEPIKQPETGTKEWREAILEWCLKIEFCVSQIGTSELSGSEVNLIRNINKYRGDPWSMGASQFMEVYSKLKRLHGHD